MSDRAGSVLGNVRAVWRVLRPGERRRWLALAPLGAVAAALEVVCAGAVFTLVSALDGDAAGPLGEALASVGLGDLRGVAAATVALFLFKAVVAVAVLRATHRAIEVSRAAVASRLFAGALDAPWTLHLERGVLEAANDLLQRTRAAFVDVVTPAAQLVTQALTALALLGVLLATAPWVTLWVALALAAWALTVHRATHRLIERAGRAEDAAHRRGLATVLQTLGALREIRSIGREGFFHQRFVEVQADLERTRFTRSTLAALPRVGTELLFVLVMLVAVFALEGEAQRLPVLGLCGYVALRLLPIVNGGVWLLGRIRWATPAVERLVAEHAMLSDPPRWRERAAPPSSEPVGVRLRGASYRWGETRVLSDLDLVIEPGEAIAVAGPTGAGKTTLLHLVSGLLQPDEGAVEVDGLPPREGATRIGYVPQEVALLEGTLRENIALGEIEIDEARLKTALHVACLDEWVAERGLDAPVGEHGERFSGGQRQRIALARALYHQPALLLLDEATAALDEATEAELMRRLRSHAEGRLTLVVVSHRPGPLAGCDRTLELRSPRRGAE